MFSPPASKPALHTRPHVPFKVFLRKFAKQTQASGLVEADADAEFTVQVVHATEPTPVLYVDALHAEHVPPSDPVYPALH